MLKSIEPKEVDMSGMKSEYMSNKGQEWCYPAATADQTHAFPRVKIIIMTF